MKRFSFATFLLISFLAISPRLSAQSINPVTGAYESQVRQGIPTENEVVVSQDSQNSKKIWISGIVREGKLYAIQTLKNREQIQYSIPAQRVGGRELRNGWVLFEFNEDGQGNDRILISNDPTSNPNQLSMDNKGIRVKDENGDDVLKTDGKGGVTARSGDGSSVKTSRNGIEAKAGDPYQAKYFSYIGRKPTAETGQDEDEDKDF